MAYLAFDDTGLAPVASGTTISPAPDAVAVRLSPLEWSVVALARRDRLSSLRQPGRMSTALRTVFKQHNPMLADERLEALRRVAVLNWRLGDAVPPGERDALFATGFSAAQYDLMRASIGVARASGEARR